MGIVERIMSDKPRSRMQRYKTTEAGPAMIPKKCKRLAGGLARSRGVAARGPEGMT